MLLTLQASSTLAILSFEYRMIEFVALQSACPVLAFHTGSDVVELAQIRSPRVALKPTPNKLNIMLSISTTTS